ncbi:unnamed protein product [Oppiella nova]|uniref:Alanine--glyoxylate aminotransferase n=1 Tax=Oppiella nova TaxID=334625 RepID=A0A7R9QT42_9ACAR|nr:unnamed protein product [Oppiella nova]CAG2172962.1 unnamed protein product [Oppiella nova]
MLMNAGPTNVSPRVMDAINQPLIHFMDPKFLEVLREISAGIRYVFQTRNQYSMALTGSGNCAMEAAICSLLETGHTFLVLVHGFWGERAALIGRKHGYNVVELRVQRPGHLFGFKRIDEAIKAHKPRLMYVCHGDSSVGTLQPLENLANVCHENGCLLLVDAVISLCCAPLNVDQLVIDAVFSGSQKALSVPPGVSFISLSPRAVERMKSRKTEIVSLYLDLILLAKAWCLDSDNHYKYNMYNYKYVYHYTPAVQLMYGLRESLAMVVEEGLQNVIERHQKCSLFVQKEITSLGLQFLVQKPEHRLSALLALWIPDHIDGQKVINDLCNSYGITISGGLGAISHQIWRLGFLGVNANPQNVNTLCKAFSEAINRQKNRE